jgi:hypothetical protein
MNQPEQLTLFAPPPPPRRRKDPMAARGQPKRIGPDFWPTPHCLIEAAVTHIVPALHAAPIWECAAGDGRLAAALGAAIATDKFPQDGSLPLDFLTTSPPGRGLIAFTNPPYHSSARFKAFVTVPAAIFRRSVTARLEK